MSTVITSEQDISQLLHVLTTDLHSHSRASTQLQMDRQASMLFDSVVSDVYCNT